jgi:prophage tail gpP-like protein
MKPEVTLFVGGEGYGGWTDIEISMGLEQIAGSFDLATTERWPGQWQARRIERGQPCRVEIDGELVIEGFVDDWLPSYDRDRHFVRVTGRDRAGDLVDCAAIHASGHWRGATLLQIARDLAAPYHLEVVAVTSPGEPFPDFALQEGETVWEALTRAAGMRGLLFVSEQGRVSLLRTGQDRHGTALEKGKNVEGAQGEFSLRDRYSDYIVKGQRRGTDDDADTPELLSGGSATVKDNGVGRYRPFIVISEEPGAPKNFARRAQWERNTRLGKSIRAHYTVSGWRENNTSGPLWSPNFKVQVRDEWLGFDGDELLIASVRFVRGNGGTFTELELTHPAAFDLLSQPQNYEQARRKVSTEAPAAAESESDAPPLPAEEEEE